MAAPTRSEHGVDVYRRQRRANVHTATKAGTHRRPGPAFVARFLFTALRRRLLPPGILAAPPTGIDLREQTGRDPFLLGAALLVLVAVAFLAGWIPARRAMQVDPMMALRYE